MASPFENTSLDLPEYVSVGHAATGMVSAPGLPACALTAHSTASCAITIAPGPGLSEARPPPPLAPALASASLPPT